MAEKKQQSGTLKYASSLQKGESSEKIYDAWADDYDNDLQHEWGYVAPQLAVSAFKDYAPENKETPIIDLGCGTGLVGLELTKAGYSIIDGYDISQNMLNHAKQKHCYRDLQRADLTDFSAAPPPFPEHHYEAAFCIGSMGAGHVGAEHLPHLLYPVKSGGLLVIYMNEEFYQADNGFSEDFEQHAQEGRWHIEHIGFSNYMDNLIRPGRLIIGRKP